MYAYVFHVVSFLQGFLTFNISPVRVTYLAHLALHETNPIKLHEDLEVRSFSFYTLFLKSHYSHDYPARDTFTQIFTLTKQQVKLLLQSLIHR